MYKFIFITILGLTLALNSCKNKEPKCEDTFLKDYNTLQSQFTNIYSPHASAFELSDFKRSITSFISKYPGTCTVNGKKYNINDELNKFLSINSQVHQNNKNRKITNARAKVIYGKDDRIEVVDSNDSRHLQWAQAVAIQIVASEIAKDGELPTYTIKDSLNLCPRANFSNQINPGRCSGFLIGEKTLITAGHCINNQADCNNLRWVFGFKQGVTKLTSSQIYSCKKIISQQVDDNGSSDFAVVELDRIVANRQPLAYRTSGRIQIEDPLTVIGHPSGLPMKVAEGANVRSNDEEWYFVANLDTFGGSSGSPVFNSETGLVEGILVRGEIDFSWSKDSEGNSCRLPFQCQDDECRGEDVIRITKVPKLPKKQNAKEILSSFFDNSTLPLETKGIALNVQVKKSNVKYLAGTKFLERCALHTATNIHPHNWLSFNVVDCTKDKKELLQVIRIFKDDE